MTSETDKTNREKQPAPDALVLNGRKFYYDEIAEYSFRNSIPIDGYEAKVLEFCKNWFHGQQEFGLHTSGSTGTPKLITLTRQQLEASARRTIRLLDLQPGDRAFVCLNAEFIAGMMMLVRGFMGNLQLTIVEPVGNPLEALTGEEQFDFAAFVPMQIQTLLEKTPEKRPLLDRMKAIIVGGAPVSVYQEELFQQVEAPLYLTYGMTETVSHIALRRLNGAERTDFFIVPDDVEIGTDDRGCLTVKADVTGNETVVTNDLVNLLSPKSFQWLGRIDNVINSGGIKVQAERVEMALAYALLQMNIHRRLFVAPLPDEKLGQRVIAVLEGEPLSEQDEANILLIMQRQLSRFEVPRQICYLSAFRVTSTGKVDKHNSMLLLG